MANSTSDPLGAIIDRIADAVVKRLDEERKIQLVADEVIRRMRQAQAQTGGSPTADTHEPADTSDGAEEPDPPQGASH